MELAFRLRGDMLLTAKAWASVSVSGRGSSASASSASASSTVLARLRQQFPPTAEQEALMSSSSNASRSSMAPTADAMLRFDERAVFDGSSTSSGKGASGGDGGATSEIAKPASPSSPPDIHILALHGWLDNAGTWDMLAPRLVEQVTDANVTFVALDMPGHGMSSHFPSTGGGYMAHAYVREIMSVAEMLGWKRFGLVSHSMGAAMTCLVASAYPERVQFTALIENLGPITRKVQEGPAQLRLYVRQMKTLADKRLPQYTSVAEAELARRAADKNLTEDGARALVRRGLKSVAPSATAIGGATTAFAWRTDPQLMTVPGLSYSEEQTLAVLEAIRCPTVLIMGKQGYRLLASGAAPSGDTFDWIDWPRRFGAVRDIRMWEFAGGHHLHLDRKAMDEGLPGQLAKFIVDAVRAAGKTKARL